jgi:cytochrome c-type biogenesis protein CcmF
VALLFTHKFRYQYVALLLVALDAGHYVFAGVLGRAGGTFLLWALITCTLGLVLMRVRHPLTAPAMFFLNLPLVMLGLVTVMRGPFLTFPPARPADGQGLNPLLQDPWMTIHPPILFTGFSSLVAPFAIGDGGAGEARLRRLDQAGAAVGGVLDRHPRHRLHHGRRVGLQGARAGAATGAGIRSRTARSFPGSRTSALLHGLLVQRVTGSLRRTNFFLAITSYALVLYASFLTRSGVLADFSVHSFVEPRAQRLPALVPVRHQAVGLRNAALSLRDIAAPRQPLGSFSRESMMWLGQLVFMLMCALTAVGHERSAHHSTLSVPPSNVQTVVLQPGQRAAGGSRSVC